MESGHDQVSIICYLILFQNNEIINLLEAKPSLKLVELGFLMQKLSMGSQVSFRHAKVKPERVLYLRGDELMFRQSVFVYRNDIGRVIIGHSIEELVGQNLGAGEGVSCDIPASWFASTDG